MIVKFEKIDGTFVHPKTHSNLILHVIHLPKSSIFHLLRYVDSNGEFLIEVRLSKAQTFYETDLLVTSDHINDSNDYDAMEVS